MTTEMNCLASGGGISNVYKDSESHSFPYTVDVGFVPDYIYAHVSHGTYNRVFETYFDGQNDFLYGTKNSTMNYANITSQNKITISGTSITFIGDTGWIGLSQIVAVKFDD